MGRKKDKFYYKDGTSGEWDDTKVLHRVDGPAAEYADGGKGWWIDGKPHRIDGPAVEFADGDREWFVDGKRHRLNGPAIMEWTDGEDEMLRWYVDDEKYSREQFIELIKQVNEMSVAMKLTDPRWWVRELGEKEVV
jgi:hypothetical protein